jgi:acid phosphatase family membrane protein YuiD
MNDAMGVRRETGNQARVINEMMEMFRNMGTKITMEDKLKEFVGHTPLQVLIGAILGIIIGVAMGNIP